MQRDATRRDALSRSRPLDNYYDYPADESIKSEPELVPSSKRNKRQRLECETRYNPPPPESIDK